MRRPAMLAIAPLLMLAAIARAAKLPDEPPVLEVPKDALPETVGLTLDGRHWAYAIKTADGKRRLVIDGKASAETYDKAGRIFLRPDGSGYEATVVKDGRTYEVHDGRRLGPYDAVPYWPIFGKNGFLAFLARKGGTWRWVVGEAALPFDVDGEHGPAAMSPDGTRMAFGALHNGRGFIVLDGKPLPEWDEVRAPQFSPDGSALVYLARAGKEWRVVVDDKPGPPMDRPALPNISARGRVAYIARRGGRDALIVDGKALGAYDQITAGPVWRDERLAYAVREGSTCKISIDGRWTPAQDGAVKDLALDARGRAKCFVVSKGGKDSVVFNGARGAAYDQAWGVRLSPDDRRCAFAAKRGSRTFAVVDGKEGPPSLSFGPPDFSKDGKHFAYAGGPERLRFVVWDGAELGPFDEASVLGPGPDVADLSYVASKGGLWWLGTAAGAAKAPRAKAAARAR